MKSSLSIVPLSYRVSWTGTKTFNSNLPSASVLAISISLISVTVSDNLALATNLITSVLSEIWPVNINYPGASTN